MAESTIIDQFMELGYEPDFTEDNMNIIGFYSKKHDDTVVKIDRLPTYVKLDINVQLNIEVLGPNLRCKYFGPVGSVLTFIERSHGIVPGFPTKGVFDEACT